MKINWIEFENKDTNLKCKKINFNDDVTLLVGLSGVGKTLILDAIKTSFIAATNKYRNNPTLNQAFYASVNFTIDDKNYEWSFETKKRPDDISEESPQFEFAFEKLTVNQEVIIERNNDNIILSNYTDFPNPRKDESLLSQYSEDAIFKETVNEIKKIFPFDMDRDIRIALNKEDFLGFKNRLKTTKCKKFDGEKHSNLITICKLYLVKKYDNEIFVKIFDFVKELFPEIEDIDIIEDTATEFYVVSIKVYGVNILQKSISNGMLKSIYYIIELLTLPKDSVVLIDEFENGLGVNCIDLLLDLILSERKDLQFIITSHHPKLIDNIDPVKWKIIDRDGSTIKSDTLDELGIKGGQNNAYFNLLNRWEYEGKI